MKLPHQLHRIDRLKAMQKAAKTDALLFTSASTIKWLSGYFYNFEIGPSPFQVLPAALLVDPTGHMSMVIADNELFPEPSPDSVLSVERYSSYVHEKPLNYTYQFLDKLHKVIEENGLKKAYLGIELNSLPFVIVQSLQSKYPGIILGDISQEIVKLKAVKDNDEIENIRMATALCDIGQSAVVKHARAGITELELFNLVRLEIEAEAGTRVPVMVDLVSGARTASGGGIPSNRVIQNGDTVLSDLTPCLNGYWGDSCNTIVVGEPSYEYRQTFNTVKEALDIAINAIRPGVKAMKIDSLMRNHVGGFPHHGGHGVGTMNHEEPRIVPYSDMELLQGMVIALEPAIYKNDYGIRLEHMVVVTESGCDLLTKFNH